MHKFLVLTLILFFAVGLCGCTSGSKASNAMKSANSDRLKKLQTQYKSKNEDLNRQAQNKTYTYENDILKIELK